MLSSRPTVKIVVGTGRLKPPDRLNATAHTDSRSPEQIRTIHAMTDATFDTVVLAGRVRHVLVRAATECGSPSRLAGGLPQV
jgi:hypothetical protein